MAKRNRNRNKTTQKQNVQTIDSEIQNAIAESEVVKQEVYNGLGDLIPVGTGGFFSGSAQVSKTDTLYDNNRYYLISNQRQILNTLYAEHGIIQTLIDQPVDDAFRKGFEIKSDELSEDEVQQLYDYMRTSGAIRHFIQAIKWKRLFGGAGLIIVTGQKPDSKLVGIRQGEKLAFKSADLWELNYNKTNLPNYDFDDGISDDLDVKFNYYGNVLNPTRVLVMKGKEAPSFIRQRMRGWGMSEVERIVRSFNKYLKNGNTIFELLDEAKIDVMKFKGLNASMLSPAGTENIRKRTEMASQLKNFLNILVMDVEDEYDQKTINFSGLSDTLTNIRQEIASDVKMPITKLFGVSSSGFNSGEDDIENYNSMVESEIREKEKDNLTKLIKICASQQFGIELEDLQIEFPPLRVLTAEQEENVKEKVFGRVISAFNGGLLSPKEAKQCINADHLLPIEIAVDDELYNNPAIEFTPQTGETNA